MLLVDLERSPKTWLGSKESWKSGDEPRQSMTRGLLRSTKILSRVLDTGGDLLLLRHE